MKVAIIGAGLAGLSCAHELEKHGVSPVIYEQNGYIGEPYSQVSAFLEITHRPVKDAILFIREEFGIELQPLNTLEKLVHHSPNKTTVVSGSLGYLFRRGKEDYDIKKQIHAQLKASEVLFEVTADYDKLSKEYDYVVIATGNPAFAMELGCWQGWFDGFARGAAVLGDFDPNTLTMWLDKSYAKEGYAYLVPHGEKAAYIILILSNVSYEEADYYWELFLYTENIRYTMIEEFKVKHFAGLVYPHRLGNLFFAGDAGGGVDPFLGFGQFNSIVMGVMAARAMVNGSDYEKLIKDIVKRNTRFYQFRKSFNKLSNNNFDALLTAMRLPGARRLVYRTPLNVVKYGSYLIGKGNGKRK